MGVSGVKTINYKSYSEGLREMAEAKYRAKQKTEAVLSIAKDIQRAPEKQQWHQYNETVEISVTRDENNQLWLHLFSNADAHENGNLKIGLKDKSGLFTRLLAENLDTSVKQFYLKEAKDFIESAFKAFD